MNKTLFILMLILLPTVTAISISPATQDIVLHDNLTYTLTVTNEETIPINITITAQGELLLPLHETLMLEPGQQEQLIVQLQRRQETQPGILTQAILIEQEATHTGMVVATPALRHRITVTVPAQGKHIKHATTTSALSSQLPAVITTRVTHTGTQDIEQVRVTHAIYDPQEREITQQQTAIRPLNIGDTQAFTNQWTPPTPGRYSLKTTVSYDGQTQAENLILEVGTLRINPEQPVISDVGKQLLIQIPVTSEWNEPLRTHAEITLSKNGVAAGRTITPTETLSPQGKTVLASYIPKEELSYGTYQLTAKIYYANTHITITFPVHIEPTEPTRRLIGLELGALAILMSVLVLDVVVRIRRRGESSR